MKRDRMQASRYELKYLITESTADKIRDFVRSYLSIDEYGVGKPNYSYHVHSLYLDSDNLELYWRTVNGDKNRFKLRLRYYGEAPGTPVFFEIKRRMKDIIIKQRGGVRKELAAELLAGHLPTTEDVLTKEAKGVVALQRFIQLMSGLAATPKAHIFYKREAYVSDDDKVRVTMDRDVFAEPQLHANVKTRMTKPVHAYADSVILELKFTDRFPDWFGSLVRMANAVQCGAAKYVSSINLIGHRRLQATDAVIEEESLLSSFRPGDDRPTAARQDLGIYPDPCRL
jgi:hypothetical protein